MDIKSRIDEFKNKKDVSDALSKEVKKLGWDIKEYFVNNNLTELDTDLCTAKISISENVSFNEEFAIEILRNKYPEEFKKVIRMKEYIDQDALESIVYNSKEISDAISKAFSTKEPTIRLLVKAKKK